MTFSEYAVKYCTNRSLNIKQAQTVLRSMQADKSLGLDAKHWKENIDDYPPTWKAVFNLTINASATKVIEETMPIVLFYFERYPV